MRKYLIIKVLLASVFFMAGECAFADTKPGELKPVKDASEAFVRLPSSYLKILDKNTRLDMLDYYAADSVWNATNAMRGFSRLDTVSADYLKVRVTDVSTYQIRLLPLRKGGNIVAAVYTIDSGDGAPDSQIFFFDQYLQPLEQKRFFKQPGMNDFLSIPSTLKKESKRLQSLIPFPTIEFYLSAENDHLTGELTIGKYMTREDYAEISPYLRRNLNYVWDGKQFRLVK